MMENPFPFSSDNKRYQTFNYYLRKRFGGKVFKVPLNGGFTCPNIDGTKGTGGCTYCSSSGSGDFAGDVNRDVLTQFRQVKQTLHKKWPQANYIAYFQAHTNTYAPLERLKEIYEPVLNEENVVGLSIATRPDCLEDDVVDYLGELAKRTYLVVELGLQSVFDTTGERINRCHTFADFMEGYVKLRRAGVLVCVHLIDGLPGETREMMLQTAKTLAALDLHSVKIHLLHVLRGTAIADELSRGAFSLLTQEEYVSIVCDQLELFPPEFVIQRVTGDPKREDLIGPTWCLRKFVVMNEIDKELVRRQSWQGKRFEKV